MGSFVKWIDSMNGVINKIIAPTGAQIGSVEDKIRDNARKDSTIHDITTGMSQVISGKDQPTTIIPNEEKPLENKIVDNSVDGTLTDKLLNESIMKPLANDIEKADEIENKKDENTNGNNIDFKELIDDTRKYSEEQQQKLWDREDKIRAETQAREDNAYQRAIKDMRKAGINPNLINISPAQSGGGITQASKSQETTASEVNGAYNMIMNAINNDKDIQENTRDRLNTLVSTALHAYLMFKFMK